MVTGLGTGAGGLQRRRRLAPGPPARQPGLKPSLGMLWASLAPAGLAGGQPRSDDRTDAPIGPLMPLTGAVGKSSGEATRPSASAFGAQ
jgi:hypothetical protein